MRFDLAMLVVPIFAQCQSEVQALRFTLPVRIWEGSGSSPFYDVDGLWLPEHGVICEMQLPPGVLPNAGAPWRIVARVGNGYELQGTSPVHIPLALADRLVELARRGLEQPDEQIALAAALIALGAVSSDPIEREIQEVEARNAQSSTTR